MNQELGDALVEEVEVGDGEVFEKELLRGYEDLKMQNVKKHLDELGDVPDHVVIPDREEVDVEVKNDSVAMQRTGG